MKKLVALTLTLALLLTSIVAFADADTRTMTLSLTLATEYEWSVPETLNLVIPEEADSPADGNQFEIEVSKLERMPSDKMLRFSWVSANEGKLYDEKKETCGVSYIVASEGSSGWGLITAVIFDGTGKKKLGILIDPEDVFTYEGQLTDVITFTAAVTDAA